MELSKHYNPADTEQKWYRHWTNQGYFNSKPDSRVPFTVVIPPPNVTGVLHMGHTLNETVQDILVRKARMSGFNACWVPGSDHASIATEAKVVQLLKEKGIDKNSLSRQQFLTYAFEWKEKYGGIIYSQIERLGCSVDWSRVSFTMDDHYYKAVIKVFVDLHKKGLIYRGARMINWDPAAKTALSDEEVEYKEQEGKLYFVRYAIVSEETEGGGLSSSSPDFVVIATQRPETIMGDTAVCVNPNDERYSHLKGKYAIVPLVNRRVPVIFDDYVDPSFGTGALKVTPAHDINDYNLGLKHQLPVIDTLNDDGTLSEAASVFVGLDRFEARKKVTESLEEAGQLLKVETYSTRLGYSQRTNAVVEPRISTQWFLKMKQLAGPALSAVETGDIHIHPGDKFLATYKYWLENVKDWCISRQLWWGQQIPAWYDGKGNVFVAETEEEARAAQRDLKNPECSSSITETGTTPAADEDDIFQRDEDVLDTWFSSWLWPMEVFHGISEPENAEINYYYPSSVLVTGQDIIFFWVARMIMAGMHYQNKRPFADVYFTGMVRDKQGRKMSKSLGNSPDLLELIDQYGADAVRFGIMIASPAGNDLLFDESALEQGRNFNNKIWNALKLLHGWGEKVDANAPAEEHFAVNWFQNKLNETRTEIDKLFREFRLSEALKKIYSLIWDDYCSWYLEWVKPAFGQPMPRSLYISSVRFFEQVLQLLHPFMPFISEEIYHQLDARKPGDDLCMKQFETPGTVNTGVLQAGEDLKLFLTGCREFRQEHQIRFLDAIPRIVVPESLFGHDATIYHIIRKQVNISQVDFSPVVQQSGSGHPFTIFPFKNHQILFETSQVIDSGKRRDELEKELEYLKGFLDSVNKKLSNEKFVRNAKQEIVQLEEKKRNDAEDKIRVIQQSLASL